MSKIICDICGTSYPDTATQCPICGSVRPAEVTAVSEDSQESTGYTYVKGGRFSKSNVRKRNQGAVSVAAGKKSDSNEKKPLDSKRVSLIVVLICLLLIVIAMFVYIGITMHNQALKPDNDNQSSLNGNVSCTSLSVNPLEFTMTQKNEGLKLEVKFLPENCTDRPLFDSSDVNVVTVDDNGNVVCVGNGKAVITVTCGQQKKECRVTCTVEEEPDTPTETDPAPTANVRLMRYNITDAFFKDMEYDLYAESDVPQSELSWVSDDPSVATVDNTGKVYTVGNGETDIHAKYQGVIVATCHIKCDFKDPDVDNSQEGIDDADQYQFGSIADGYTNALSVEWDGYYGVTLGVGQKFKFGLIHKTDSSKNISLQWERVNPNDSDTSVTISEDKLWITRTEAGSSPYCLFVATYNGTKYYLRIR